MCKVVITTNHLNIFFTCETCNCTYQNPRPFWPVEWLEEHGIYLKSWSLNESIYPAK